jgi:hypothetical protein
MNAFAMVGAVLGMAAFALAVRAIFAIGYLQKKIEALEREGRSGKPDEGANNANK